MEKTYVREKSACSNTDSQSGVVAAGAGDAGSGKVIGVIGGISWVSSEIYYRRMNEIMRDRFGSLHSANVLLYSIPFHAFAEQERLASSGDWTMLTATMVSAANRLKAGGAEMIVIASNTLNSLDFLLESTVGLPVVRIIDAVGRDIVQRGLRRVALLGTKYTMETDFYRGRLERDYGLSIVVPDAMEQDYVNNVIFDELCNNRMFDESREGYRKIIERLASQEGAEGVILGCTEIPLLIRASDVTIPIIDSTESHVTAAVTAATSTVAATKQCDQRHETCAGR